MMERLAQAIGLPALQAVIDDFIAALRHHPMFAATMSGVEQLDRLRHKLVSFWAAVLDGESYRVSSASFSSLFAGTRHEWRAAYALFARAIQRHVPGYLARLWQQRLDWFGQSLPLQAVPA